MKKTFLLSLFAIACFNAPIVQASLVINNHMKCKIMVSSPYFEEITIPGIRWKTTKSSDCLDDNLTEDAAVDWDLNLQGRLKTTTYGKEFHNLEKTSFKMVTEFVFIICQHKFIISPIEIEPLTPETKIYQRPDLPLTFDDQILSIEVTSTKGESLERDNRVRIWFYTKNFTPGNPALKPVYFREFPLIDFEKLNPDLRGYRNLVTRNNSFKILNYLSVPILVTIPEIGAIPIAGTEQTEAAKPAKKILDLRSIWFGTIKKMIIVIGENRFRINVPLDCEIWDVEPVLNTTLMQEQTITEYGDIYINKIAAIWIANADGTVSFYKFPLRRLNDRKYTYGNKQKKKKKINHLKHIKK